jgi:hypothetical protein
VQIDTDFFVIETYQQLLAVVGVVAGVVVLVVALLRRSRRNRKALQAAPAISVAPKRRPPSSDGPSRRGLDAGRADFERLAAVVGDVRTRAETVSATQSRAALKLDTVEMAVHRVLVDIDGIMVAPRAAPAAAIGGAPQTVEQHPARVA